MNAFTIVTVLTYICMPISVFLNVFLMLVVAKHSAKYLIPYRQPIIITAVANATLSIWNTLSQHTFVLRNQILLVFFLGPVRFTSVGVCYFIEFINIALFLFTCHQPLFIFVYRYHIIFRNKTMSRFRIYLTNLWSLIFNSLISYLYLHFSYIILTPADEAKYLRWAKEIRRTPDPAYIVHKTGGTGKMSSLILFIYLLSGCIGVYAMHEWICYRLKSSKNAISHSRTLQMARAIITMTAGTFAIGCLPFSALLLSVVFDIEMGVWAIPVSLGSAFIPILAPIIIFYKVEAYRSSLRAVVLEFLHNHQVSTGSKTTDQHPHAAWPTQ